MSLVSYHFSTLQYIRRLYNSHQVCLTRNCGTPPRIEGTVDLELSPSPRYSYERLKVGKLHILTLKVMRHICSPNLLTLLVRLLSVRGCHHEFRSLNAQRYTQGSFIPLKLWLLILVSKTIKTTLPPQQ